MFQNAFGGNGTARVSPAEVVAIYGPGIGPATAVSATPTNGFYPTTLGGVEVSVNGTNIPLLYVSANQINAVIPNGSESELSGNGSGHQRNGGRVLIIRSALLVLRRQANPTVSIRMAPSIRVRIPRRAAPS